jgi:hypothetical protein
VIGTLFRMFFLHTQSKAMNTLGIFFEVGDSCRFGLFQVGGLVGEGCLQVQC